MTSTFEDRAEIRELKHEYCYATDDLDVDRIVATKSGHDLRQSGGRRPRTAGVARAGRPR